MIYYSHELRFLWPLKNVFPIKRGNMSVSTWLQMIVWWFYRVRWHWYDEDSALFHPRRIRFWWYWSKAMMNIGISRVCECILIFFSFRARIANQWNGILDEKTNKIKKIVYMGQCIGILEVEHFDFLIS